MEGDADLDGARQVPGFGLEAALQIDGSGDGIGGVGEDDEAGVALATGADVDAVACLHDAIDDFVVADHGGAHRLLGVFPEPSGAFDVRE